LAAASCNCNAKLSDVCQGCPGACVDGKCRCTSDADCATHYQCFSGTCLCADSTCIAQTDSGATGGGGGGCLESACGGGAVMDAGAGGGMANGGGTAMGGGSAGGGGGTGGGGTVVDAGCATGTK